jgi:hypothetical protein
MPKRFNFRVKIGIYTFFGMISETQTLEGVTSLQPDSTHIIMFDSIDNCNLKSLEKKWLEIQQKYNLSDVFILSDKEGSYRIWCFTKVKFNVLLQILLDAYVFLDWNFFYWTVSRGKATLRTSNKVCREQQKTVSVLESYSVPIPEIMQHVIYDTGIEKTGLNLILSR